MIWKEIKEDNLETVFQREPSKALKKNTTFCKTPSFFLHCRSPS
jgi:hypothetical protein